MNITKTLLIAAPLLMLPQLANAAICQVDPAGAFGMPFATVDAALSGPCNTPGSIIEVYCPLGGCVHPGTTVSGLNDIYIVSAELWGFGSVTMTNSYSGNAVSIQNSTGIVFEGFDSYVANNRAIEIINSDATILGPVGLGRYSHTSANTGVFVGGDSDVDLHWVGFRFNKTGLELSGGAGPKGPKVLAEGVAALNNDVAVHSHGSNGPRLDIRGDSGPTLHNYVMRNHEGVIAEGNSLVEIDHTIFAGNLRLRPGSPAFPNLLEVANSASMALRNTLIYDNDAVPNPGVQLPWSAWSGITACGGSPCTNTNGRILQHDSMGGVTITASTIIDNQTDLVFNLLNTGSGQLLVDHTIMAHNWGKVFSMSTWWPSCPPATGVDSFFWDNRVDADPVACTPPGIGTWNPGAISAGYTPDTLFGYPTFTPSFMDLYWVTQLEPSAAPIPGGLYLGPAWTVDGATMEVGALDVGYHNPL